MEGKKTSDYLILCAVVFVVLLVGAMVFLRMASELESHGDEIVVVGPPGVNVVPMVVALFVALVLTSVISWVYDRKDRRN